MHRIICSITFVVLATGCGPRRWWGYTTHKADPLLGRRAGVELVWGRRGAPPVHAIPQPQATLIVGIGREW